MKNKQIVTVCMKCGLKHDRKHKSSMGVWIGDCDMCGEKKIPVADAAHDFGIYSTKAIEEEDKFQDLI